MAGTRWLRVLLAAAVIGPVGVACKTTMTSVVPRSARAQASAVPTTPPPAISTLARSVTQGGYRTRSLGSRHVV